MPDPSSQPLGGRAGPARRTYKPMAHSAGALLPRLAAATGKVPCRVLTARRCQRQFCTPAGVAASPWVVLPTTSGKSYMLREPRVWHGLGAAHAGRMPPEAPAMPACLLPTAWFAGLGSRRTGKRCCPHRCSAAWTPWNGHSRQETGVPRGKGRRAPRRTLVVQRWILARAGTAHLISRARVVQQTVTHFNCRLSRGISAAEACPPTAAGLGVPPRCAESRAESHAESAARHSPPPGAAPCAAK